MQCRHPTQSLRSIVSIPLISPVALPSLSINGECKRLGFRDATKGKRPRYIESIGTRLCDLRGMKRYIRIFLRVKAMFIVYRVRTLANRLLGDVST